MTTATATATKISFGSFTIERKYNHKPERVFRAFEDPEAHYRWFVSGEGWEIANYTHDFRVGGHEHGNFRPVGHPAMFGNDTRHLEIIKGQRIVSAYTMSVDGKPFSHSLATIELIADGPNGCKLTYTEQGAYFGGEGEQEIKNRKAGCEELFGKLEIELKTHS
jgi:uncharacterized protein YndB with AHSA1/START domain